MMTGKVVDQGFDPTQADQAGMLTDTFKHIIYH
jgi:hypothetical protein